MDRDSTTVNIFGQEYAVRSENDGAYVREVAHFVDQRMREVSRQSHQVSSLRVAVLAAMTLADELMKERDGETVKGLEERARALAETLEENLAFVAEEGASPEGSPGPGESA